MQALESEGWLKVLCPKWTVAKADIPELTALLKTRATMAEFNISVDAAPAIMHFLTLKLGESEVAAIQTTDPASRVCGGLDSALKAMPRNFPRNFSRKRLHWIPEHGRSCPPRNQRRCFIWTLPGAIRQ